MKLQPRRSRGLQTLLLLVTVPGVTGCLSYTTPGTAHSDAVIEHEVHCARATMGRFSPYRMPLAEPIDDLQQARWLDVLPPIARRTARAAGLEPLLLKMLQPQLHAGLTQEPQATVSSSHQELTLRLIAFDTQVSALGFETECTRRRVGDLARELDTQEGDRQLRLATGSLIIGASTGIAAGALDLSGIQSDVPAILAVAGSAVSAVLGVIALSVPERDVRLQHHHNLLRPIFVGEDPDHLYPSFVFRMLTRHYQPDDPPTPRDLLMQDFEQILQHSLPWPEWDHAREVLFGDGGVYSRELLEVRQQMMQSLQSSVQGVARDLELFNRALVRLLASPIHHARVQRIFTRSRAAFAPPPNAKPFSSRSA